MAYIFPVLIFAFALAVIASSIRIAKEFERGVVFRLGRLIKLKGPGVPMKKTLQSLAPSNGAGIVKPAASPV